MIPVIFGPTAIGKTELLLSLSDHFPIEAISMDSMQIYTEMDIGTAKPTHDERQRLRHWMIDIVRPDEPFDAFSYARLCKACIADVQSRGKIPIVAGGTGLYLDALLYGIAQGVQRDELVRAHLESQERERSGFLYQRLQKIDPPSAQRIHPNDLRRIIRALEIHQITGKPWSDLRIHHQPDPQYRLVILSRDRSELYRRIEARAPIMVDSGLIDETRMLVQRYGTEHASMKAIGYRQTIQYLQEEISSIDDLKSVIARDTRHYARRQIIWGRKYSHALHWQLGSDPLGSTPHDWMRTILGDT